MSARCSNARAEPFRRLRRASRDCGILATKEQTVSQTDIDVIAGLYEAPLAAELLRDS